MLPPIGARFQIIVQYIVPLLVLVASLVKEGSKPLVSSLKMSIITNIEERHVEKGAMAELMLLALKMPQQQCERKGDQLQIARRQTQTHGRQEDKLRLHKKQEKEEHQHQHGQTHATFYGGTDASRTQDTSPTTNTRRRPNPNCKSGENISRPERSKRRKNTNTNIHF